MAKNNVVFPLCLSFMLYIRHLKFKGNQTLPLTFAGQVEMGINTVNLG